MTSTYNKFASHKRQEVDERNAEVAELREYLEKLMLDDEASEYQKKLDYLLMLHQRKGELDITVEEIQDKIAYNMQKWKCDEITAADMVINYYLTIPEPRSKARK